MSVSKTSKIMIIGSNDHGATTVARLVGAMSDEHSVVVVPGDRFDAMKLHEAIDKFEGFNGDLELHERGLEIKSIKGTDDLPESLKVPSLATKQHPFTPPETRAERRRKKRKKRF